MGGRNQGGLLLCDCNAIQHNTMKAFRITPKRIRRSNGQVLTPEMSVVVSTNLSNPFNNGAKEVAEAYMRIYDFDYKRSCCCKADFDCVLLG